MNVNCKKFAINFFTTIILIIAVGFNLIVGFNDAKIFKSEFDEIYIIQFDNDMIAEMKERTLGTYRYHKMFKVKGENVFYPAINDNNIWEPDFMKVGDIISKNNNSTEMSLNRNGVFKIYTFPKPGRLIDFIEKCHIYVSRIFLILVIGIYVLPYRLIKPIFEMNWSKSK